MTPTRLTVGGFTQTGVARALIEMPANAEKGLSHRFLWLAVGGFTQTGVGRALIEMPANAEKGLSHRFLWLFPNPLYKKLSNLGVIDQDFLRTISKKLTNTSLPAAYCTRSSVNILLICTLLALTFMISINCLIHLSRFTNFTNLALLQQISWQDSGRSQTGQVNYPRGCSISHLDQPHSQTRSL